MANEQEYARLVEKFLGPLLDAFSERDAKNASRTAGRLTFWRDGMLGELEKIAAGTHDENTIAALKEKFEESAPRVELAMNELNRLRERLAPSKLADQIDLVLHHDRFGKGTIRGGIDDILQDFEHGIQEDTAQYARELCHKIRTFNEELQKLGRMVRS